MIYMVTAKGTASFQNFRACSGLRCKFSGRQFQRTQNAASDTQSAPKTQAWTELVFTDICRVWIPRNFLVETTLTTCIWNGTTACQIFGGGKRSEH
jgi:hypothetical protein